MTDPEWDKDVAEMISISKRLESALAEIKRKDAALAVFANENNWGVGQWSAYPPIDCKAWDGVGDPQKLAQAAIDPVEGT